MQAQYRERERAGLRCDKDLPGGTSTRSLTLAVLKCSVSIVPSAPPWLTALDFILKRRRPESAKQS
jgi:hypothetical protein